MLHICDMCADHMIQELHTSNCIAVYQFASFHNCRELKMKAKEFVMDHFSEIEQHNDLMLLGFDDIAELIADDNLNVKEEETVYDAIIRWIEYDLEERSIFLPKLLQLVRLSLIGDQFIGDNIGR